MLCCWWKSYALATREIYILNCLRGKQKGRGYGSNICLTTHPAPTKQFVTTLPFSFYIRFVVNNHKEDVLGSSDGLVVRIPCLFCSHNKSPTQKIESRVIFTLEKFQWNPRENNSWVYLLLIACETWVIFKAIFTL